MGCSASINLGREHWHSNQGAHQITADTLRAAADALAAEKEKTSSPNNKKSTNEARRSADDRYSEKTK